MNLGDVLSKPPKSEFTQVDSFLLNKKGDTGQQVTLSAGKVMLNYFCSRCDDTRTFISKGKLSCVFVDKKTISIDCVITCGCGSSVQIWFLIESDDDIRSQAPNIRILKRSEKLSNNVLTDKSNYNEFSDLLEKSQRAYRDRLGAGSMVYLRKIFEQVTAQAADGSGISRTNTKGYKKNFKELLKEVDRQCSIIPREFSENGYKLFGELSEIVHGKFDEELALEKYESLNRLIVGVLDNVKNNKELMQAIGTLGWNQEDHQ